MSRIRLAAAFAALSVFATSLGGCVNLLPNPEVPLALIALPPDRAAAPAAPLQADVSVLPPDSSRAYSGVDIAVSSGQELVYLADVRWADAAPRLMQNAVANALSKAGGEGRVTTAQQGVIADYELRWRIVDLSVSKDVGPVRIALSASLVDAGNRRSVAQTQIEATGAPTSSAPRDRAAALAAAAQQAADKVADFVTKNAKPVPAFGATPAPTPRN